MNDSTFKKAKILIVDDQQANIDVLTGLLDVKGYTNYTTTNDSRQVFKLFDELKPDLLLLDLIMPHISGYQVMLDLKSLIPSGTYTPILVLTADITPEAKQKALVCGASDFLSKPFDLIEVDLRIKNLLSIRLLHKQLENQNQILENRVKEKTKELEKTSIDLNVAKEKAEQSDKLKTELFNQISQTKIKSDNNEEKSELTKHTTEQMENSRTVLYVNDNLPTLQAIEQIFETHRPTIHLITNNYGKNAVQFAIDHTTDLILLDIHLPDIHGSEVINLLRAEPKTSEIPVIIFGVDAITEQIEQFIETGTIDYLLTPIDEAQFLNLVDKRIRKKTNSTMND